MSLAKCVGLLCFALCSTTASVAADDARRLARLIDEDWNQVLEEDPLFATEVGDHRADDRLPRVAPEDHLRRHRHDLSVLERLAAIDRAALDLEDAIDYDILKRLVSDRIAEHRHSAHLMPITNRSGFHVSFPELRERVPLRTVADYDNYIARLRGFRDYAHQHIELMRRGLKLGFVLPSVVLAGVGEVVAPHVVEDPSRSLLFRPFQSFPNSFSPTDATRLREQGAEAIRSSVVPGFAEFEMFLARQYLPGLRATIAASDLPDGKAFYAHRVRRYTTLDWTPDRVHDLGLTEVARIREEMTELVERIGFEGGLTAFLEHLRTDPEFYAETPEQLMKEVAWVLKRMDGELPRLFGNLPRMPYGIRPVPDNVAPKTTTAYYRRPAGDGTRAGVYFVNTFDLPSRPLYEVEALSLHEAVPGHHLQIAIQQELSGLRPFRRFTGFTAFVEGWALYAESLGLEVGLYQDAYSNFGRLTYDMWRACRLVVDTGMHWRGWSRGRAIDYMAANTALARHNIETEVDRYIAWPGQALAYKTGELVIRKIRERAELRLGPAFDLREFHDVVLGSGSVPLDVLEDNVERYLDRASANGGSAVKPD